MRKKEKKELLLLFSDYRLYNKMKEIIIIIDNKIRFYLLC